MNGFKEVSPKREMAKGWTVDKQRHEKYVYELGGNEFKRKSSNTRSEWKTKIKTKREAKKPTENNESVFQRDLCERVEMLTFRSAAPLEWHFFYDSQFFFEASTFLERKRTSTAAFKRLRVIFSKKSTEKCKELFRMSWTGWTNVCLAEFNLSRVDWCFLLPNNLLLNHFCLTSHGNG